MPFAGIDKVSRIWMKDADVMLNLDAICLLLAREIRWLDDTTRYTKSWPFMLCVVYILSNWVVDNFQQ